MIRHAAAVAVALCLSPSWVYAQGTELTVNTASANVHQGPSTGSPVIGKASRGAVLEVTRELGDWVKVSWAAAPDSVGYVHLSAGSIARNSTLQPTRAVGFTSTGPAPQSAYPTTIGVQAEQIGAGAQPAVYVAPPAHIVGLGGRVSGSTVGFGATARAWSRKRLGMQLEVSRYSLTSLSASGRVTSIQFAPSLLYSLTDRVSDYAWVRPYLGAGGNLSRSTQTGFGSTNNVGFQAFGGSEVTFPSFPRFALSADVGYRWSRAPFDGFEIGGLGFTVSGHWYVK